MYRESSSFSQFALDGNGPSVEFDDTVDDGQSDAESGGATATVDAEKAIEYFCYVFGFHSDSRIPNGEHSFGEPNGYFATFDIVTYGISNEVREENAEMLAVHANFSSVSNTIGHLQPFRMNFRLVKLDYLVRASFQWERFDFFRKLEL